MLTRVPSIFFPTYNFECVVTITITNNFNITAVVIPSKLIDNIYVVVIISKGDYDLMLHMCCIKFFFFKKNFFYFRLFYFILSHIVDTFVTAQL
jgi:hypothetical protein